MYVFLVIALILPLVVFQTFNSVFNKAMERAEWDEDVRTRVHTLTEAITYYVFLYTSQGLSERQVNLLVTHCLPGEGLRAA